jgi:hypothetical protein
LERDVPLKAGRDVNTEPGVDTLMVVSAGVVGTVDAAMEIVVPGAEGNGNTATGGGEACSWSAKRADIAEG